MIETRLSFAASRAPRAMSAGGMMLAWSRTSRGAALTLLLAMACKMGPSQDESAPSSPSGGAGAGSTRAQPPATERLTFVPAGAGDAASVVQAELARATAAGRRLVVYEGATWCEPCRNFHEAAQRGDLDSAFPHLTLLEFDADKDGDRLRAAGYGSEYIPLFAIPGKDGRALGPKEQGGIKGDGVVAFLTQKLRALLATNP